MAKMRLRVAPDNGTRETEWRLGAFDGLSIVAGRHSRLQQRVDECFNIMKNVTRKELYYYFQIHL